VSALQEVAEALDPELRSSVQRPASGVQRFETDYVLEAVYEGYLLHYGVPRLVATEDEDLRLLAGDSLYALGLARLSEEGDLPGVARLADLITGCAKAHAEGNQPLADGLWATASR
jgi:hypothetical protein